MDGYYVHLSDIGKSVDTVKFRYYKLPKDEAGQPMIPERLRLAAALFVRWCWEMRLGDNQSGEQNAYNRWRAERDARRGEMKMPEPVEMKAIERYWVSMLPNFNHNRF